MSHHLHLFSDYHASGLANFSSHNARPVSRAIEPAPGIAEPASSALLDLSWIEPYPATQQRIARIIGVARSSVSPPKTDL